MGQVETAARLRGARRIKKEKRLEQRRNVQRTILGIVAAAGCIALAIAAPNTLKLLKYLPRRKYAVHSAIDRLVDRGELRRVSRREKPMLEITDRGRKRLTILSFADAHKKHRSWDGKWRVVVFDVPEALRGKRDLLRDMLRRIGFVQIQQSVWAYPHECEEFIQLVKTDLSLRGRIKYLVCESLEGDVGLGRRFGLWI